MQWVWTWGVRRLGVLLVMVAALTGCAGAAQSASSPAFQRALILRFGDVTMARTEGPASSTAPERESTLPAGDVPMPPADESASSPAFQRALMLRFGDVTMARTEGPASSTAPERESTLAAGDVPMPPAGEPASDAAPEQALTLAECLVLAVRNNRDLAAGRLDRLAGRLSLADAEDEFRLAPAFEASVDRSANVSTLGVSPRVVLRLPTGGRVSLSTGGRVTNRDTADQFVELEFVQPLLKGGGIEVGTAGVASARRTEQIGVLAFKSAVMGLVTRTIYAYRTVVRSMRAVEIAERSVQRARDLLAVNRVLIETGRMAEQDIVQTEASVAERELSLIEAQGALDDARLALAGILDIDSRVRVRPVETSRLDPKGHDAGGGVERALQHRPDYLRALLSLENASTALRVADDARRWQLDLTTSARFGHSAQSLSEAYRRFDDDYGVGLRLNIPLGTSDAAQRRRWERAGLASQQSRLRLQELRQAIELEVRGAQRDVEVQRRRSELAQEARRLARRKLDIERLKLNAGLTSNFRLVRFEDDLVRSQNAEVGARIAYLNALTARDRALGTTLQTWQIDIGLPAGGGTDS